MTVPPIGTIIAPKRTPIRIHVNQHTIRANKLDGGDQPVITVKRGGDNFYCNGVEVVGTVRIVYSGGGCDAKPILPCGARVIMETNDSVKIIG